MTDGLFTQTIKAWVEETKERQVAVFRESVKRFYVEMTTPVGAGGNMPVRDGFLRASAAANLTDTLPPKTYKPKTGGPVPFDPGEVNLVIAQADLTDVITIAFTANYARFVNDGARGRPPRQFVGLAVQRWPQIVADTCADVASGRLTGKLTRA